MKLSLLTCAMNRLEHIKKTYIKNIESCKEYLNDDIEFVLLNFNSNDDLDSWVASNLKKLPINFNYIKTNKPKFFDMALTKNITGKFATGDVLCWVDADNYISNEFINFVFEKFSNQKNIALNVNWSPKTEGMCGRVVCKKEDFVKINGYDESMKGWGYEDIDFTERLKRLGVSVEEIPNHLLSCISHSSLNRLKNYNQNYIRKLSESHPFSQMKYESNYRNFLISQQNIKENKIKANVNKDWGILEL